MKRLNQLLVLSSIIALSSCTLKDPYSKGFEYSFNLGALEIAYRVEKLNVKKGEDVTIYVSYGHSPGSHIPYYEDGSRLVLNLCLFLDYGNDEYDNSKIENYKNFDGCLLLEEIEVDKFYTEEYEYTQNRKGKKFAYEKEITIPYSYLKDRYNRLKNEYVLTYTFTFYVFQMVYNNEKKELTHCYSTSIYFYYSFNEDTGNIKVEI